MLLRYCHLYHAIIQNKCYSHQTNAASYLPPSNKDLDIHDMITAITPRSRLQNIRFSMEQTRQSFGATAGDVWLITERIITWLSLQLTENNKLPLSNGSRLVGCTRKDLGPQTGLFCSLFLHSRSSVNLRIIFFILHMKTYNLMIYRLAHIDSDSQIDSDSIP